MEDCETPVSKSKVPYDPGWNDPPTLLYGNQQITPNRPRNFLNKRVAFPLSSNNNTSIPAPVNIPPLPIGVVNPPTTSQNVIENTESQDTLHFDSESALEEVKNILMALLETNSELGTKINDIKKRISVMEDMWINKKLNVQVQIKMRDLVKALEDDDATKADNIHKALMVDHVTEVCTWMPGIKKVIYNCAARSDLLAIDKD